MVENNKKLTALEDKLKNKAKDLKQKKYNAVLENNKKSVNNYRGAAVDSAFAESRALNALNKAREEENKLIVQRKKLESDNSNLEQKITEVGGIDIKKPDIKKKTKDVFVEFKEVFEKEKDYFEDWVDLNPVNLDSDAEWKSIDWEAYFNLKKFEELRKNTGFVTTSLSKLYRM